MSKQKIDYIAPLTSAWDKMITILFKPFAIEKWFVLGFIAWIALLGENGNANFNSNFSLPFDNDISNSQEITTNTNSPSVKGPIGITHDVWDNISSQYTKFMNYEHSTLIIVLIVIGILIIIAIGLVINWLKARFAFIFLDSVVRNDIQVVQPWKKFKQLGNSSFLWNICFGLISFLLLIISIGILIVAALPLFETLPDKTTHIIIVVILGFLFLIEIFIFFIIYFFYKHFVIPIMYVKSIKVISAWKEFFQILRNNKLAFFIYCLIIFFSSIAISGSILIIGILTCCIGFCLMALPYIGTVVLLPVFVLYRLYSFEFLAQISEEYTLSEDSQNLILE